MSIPKIIHYCWFGGNPLSEEAERCIASWRKYCPDYEIKRWDETNFDVHCNDYVREAYAEKKYAFVSDYARLAVLYEQGGIYFDIDVELLKPIDDLLDNEGFIGMEYSAQTPYGRSLLVNTGSGVGAEAGNEIIMMLLDSYRKLKFIKDTGRFDMRACTERETPLFKKIGMRQENVIQNIDGFLILPTEYFAPLDFANGKMAVTEKTYSIHYYNNSWNNTAGTKKAVERLKCTVIGRYILWIKYCGAKKLGEIIRSSRSRRRLRIKKIFFCRNIHYAREILLDREFKLRINRGAALRLGNRVENDGRLNIVMGHYGELDIGNNVYFNDAVMISCLGKIEIGDNTLFGPGVRIFDNNHNFSSGGVIRSCREGCIHIGSNCWIASNVVILKGADIGDNSVIGAGCVIKGKIPPGSIVTLNNEQIIKKIDDR